MARSWALTLASQPNAQDLLCSGIRTLDVLANATGPATTDPNSPEQAVVLTSVMNELFEEPLSSLLLIPLSDPTKESSDLVVAAGKGLSALSQHFWPLPHPLVMAKAWIYHGELRDTHKFAVRPQNRVAFGNFGACPSTVEPSDGYKRFMRSMSIGRAKIPC